jgi:hypothetical protein
MSGLETALVILITIWSLIFVIFLVAALFIFLSIRKLLNKTNKLIDEAEEIAERFNIPSNLVMSSVLGFIAKNSFQGIKNIVSDTLLKGAKKKTSK